MGNCSLRIESLSQSEFCKNNTSGVRNVFFIPRGDIEAINAVTAAIKETFEDRVVIGNPNMGVQAITVNSGKYFAQVYCSKNLGELKYTTQGSNVGNRVQKATLEIYHAGFKKKLLGFLSTAINQEFILVVQLENGDYHLIGDMKRGAQIVEGTEAVSGKASTDNNGAAIQFEWEAPYAQVFYDGWDPADPEVGLEMWRIAYILTTEDGGYFITTEDNKLIEL